MSSEQEQKQHGHFFNGFFMGAALGAGAALLLSTHKGRKILKTLTESGIDHMSDLEDIVVDKYQEFMAGKKQATENEEPAAEPQKVPEKKEVSTPAEKTTPRKFFRSTKK